MAKSNKKQITINEMARMGGMATLKRHGKEHFQKLSHRGAEARWGTGIRKDPEFMSPELRTQIFKKKKAVDKPTGRHKE